jgi:phosphohistidine phosphatase SixA
MSLRTLSVAVLAGLLAAPVAAQPTVFLVRHAERADSEPGKSPSMSEDPDLSDAGRARAASLATLLRDAGITAIFTTEYKRTQQTAAPLAKALGLTVTVVSSKNAADLVKQIKALVGTGTGNVLVVGHSNTVPEVIKALDVPTTVTIGDDDFDNLFLLRPGQPSSLLRLHYR